MACLEVATSPRIFSSLVVLAFACKGGDPKDSSTDPTETGPDTEDTSTETEDTTDTMDTVDTEDTSPPKPAKFTLVEHGVVTCDDPSARETEGPLYQPDLGPDWNNQDIGTRWPASAGPLAGNGIAIADFTGDGIYDVFLPMWGPSRLFVGQEDGTLVDETAARVVLDDVPHDSTESATAADIDGDGDFDLVLFNRLDGNALLINDGGVLTGVPSALPSPNFASIHGSFGDMDGDGDLDLAIANHDPIEEPPEPLDGGDDNELYRNLGDGTFEDASELWPASNYGAYTFVIGWFDMDDDGKLDMYMANDRGQTQVSNRFYRNTDGQGTFEDLSDETYLGVALGAMGLAYGDINHDAIPDLAITNWGPMKSLESLPDGTWIETATTNGIRDLADTDTAATWGLQFADLDNDGDLDLPIVAGQIMIETSDKNPQRQPDTVLVNNDGHFDNEGAAWGFDDGANHRALVVTDMNGDGWLDLIARDLNGSAGVYLARCGEGAWLEVDLEQPGMNRYAIGARIEAEVDGELHIGWVHAGSVSFTASGPPRVHLGLGAATQVDALTVKWPDGTISTMEELVPNQRVTVVRK